MAFILRGYSQSVYGCMVRFVAHLMQPRCNNIRSSPRAPQYTDMMGILPRSLNSGNLDHFGYQITASNEQRVQGLCCSDFWFWFFFFLQITTQRLVQVAGGRQNSLFRPEVTLHGSILELGVIKIELS